MDDKSVFSRQFHSARYIEPVSYPTSWVGAGFSARARGSGYKF